MARIRSIHPGFFTDEAIVTVGMPIRLVLIGLWTEADDGGVFEWKPITLKMRLFPADNIDIGKMMDELVQAEVIKKAEVDGRHLGLIRNFCRYQRPKSPKYRHVIPDDLRSYVGLSALIPELSGDDDNPFPPNGEITAQMEEEGWKEPSQGKKEPKGKDRTESVTLAREGRR